MQCHFPPFHTDPLIRICDPDRIRVRPQMCLHTAIIVRSQYVGNPVVEKMAFNEALLLFICFWLHWRRLHLARARRRRIAAAQTLSLQSWYRAPTYRSGTWSFTLLLRQHYVYFKGIGWKEESGQSLGLHRSIRTLCQARMIPILKWILHKSRYFALT